MLKRSSALVLLFAGILLAADDYSQWVYFRKIDINTSLTGANVSSAVANFPLLVRLGAEDSLVFKTSRGGGQDVRFSKANGAHFPYQIERWDSAGRVAEIWVLVDTIKGSDNTQYVKMYWGNKSAADSSRPREVFDTADGFLGVYHAGGDVSNSAMNSYNGVDSATRDTAGLIGRGRKFLGTNSFFSIKNMPDRPAGTISFWFRLASQFNISTAKSAGLWGKMNDYSSNYSIGLRGSDFNLGDGSTGNLQTKMESSNASAYVSSTMNSFDSSTWYYAAWSWGGKDSLYVNGLLEKSLDSCKPVSGLANDEIGRCKFDSANVSGVIPAYLKGSMDEIRIDKTVRSKNWIKLCYKNQKLTGGADSLTKKEAPLPQPPLGLTYSKTAPQYPKGDSIAPNAAIVTPPGAVIDSFTIVPTLPAGLKLDKYDGTIYGAPTSGSGSPVVYTITATNRSGSMPCKDTITVYERPSIVTQPASTTKNAGDTAAFTLVSGGATPYAYQWIRGSTAVPGASAASLQLANVKVSDDNAIFKCVVRYVPTNDSVVSNLCTLHVIGVIDTPPSIAVQPQTVRVRRGSPASFSIAATGTAPLTYLWLKNDHDTLKKGGDTLTIDSAQRSDDNSRFQCVVNSSAGSVTSAICTLRVVSAGFSAYPTIGKDSLTVKFADSSTGGVTLYAWDFGDGATAAGPDPSHFYGLPGTYSVNQTVSVEGIVDSARVIDCIRVDSTPDTIRTVTFPNTAKMTKLAFDASLGKITAGWEIDSFDTNLEIGIAYSLITYPADSLHPPEQTLQALRPIDSATVDVKQLITDTTYYVSLWLRKKGGTWALPTQASQGTVKVPAPPAIIINTVKMTKLAFDTSRSKIVACWEIDSFDTDLEIGIAYSLITYPTDSLHPPEQTMPALKPIDSAIVDVKQLLWDTTYYVSLWLRKKGGTWALPTGASQGTMKAISNGTWNTITFFTKYPDTVSAFSGKLLLANEPGDSIPTTDTVKYWDAPGVKGKGFVPVGNGFFFPHYQPHLPFHAGIAYDKDSIPARYSAKDIRIYFDIGGELFVQGNTVLDTIHKIVWSFAGDFSRPFIAMIDTVSPTITVQSQHGDPVLSRSDLLDTFVVRDNCANSAYWYQYGTGDNSLRDSAVGTTKKIQDTIDTKISRWYVNPENSVRAMLFVSDGPHTVTEDMSRQVKSDSLSDVVSVPADQWFPLQTATQLDSPGVKQVLRGLSEKGNWHYDNTKFRLYRWYSSPANQSDSSKWVEYDDTTDWIFNLEPCNLLWLKTRKPAVLHLGSGISASLRESSTAWAASHTWTDIGLPFNFDIRVGDIIDSTNVANTVGSPGDSLSFYYWEAKDSKQYLCKPILLAGFYGMKTDSLSRNSKGFTVYNPLSTAVILTIPPIPASLSRQGLQESAKRNAQRPGWVVRIAGRTESNVLLSEVYCGYQEGAPGMKYYPTPSLFSGINIRVCDDLKRQYGHALAKGTWSREGGGVTFPLAFSNTSGQAETIDYAVQNVDMLPKDMKAEIIDYTTGKTDDAIRPSPIRVAEGQTVFRHLAVGTEAYLKKMKNGMQVFRLALVEALSKPHHSAIRIRFSLPYSGVDQVQFTIVDIMGRVVWNKSLFCGNAAGMQELLWTGTSQGHNPVVAGIYILRMAAYDGKRNVVGAFQRKIGYLP